MIDTHVHLIEPKHHQYRWIHTLPLLAGREFTLSDYWRHARPAGITRAVLMEAAATDFEKETDRLLTLVSNPANQAPGLIASCRPEQPEEEFQVFLERRASDRRIKGFRRVLHTEPEGTAETATFARNLKALGHSGKPFELCLTAKQLAIAVHLARACPGTTFILDHCGNPDLTGTGYDFWKKAIRTLATQHNVFCKVSGIAASTDADLPLDSQLRPYIETTIAHFGWNRVVWAGDWPVCLLGCSLAAWTSVTRQILNEASENERAKIFFSNATSLYDLDREDSCP